MRCVPTLRFTPRCLLAMALILLAISNLAGCSKNPVTGKREFSLVSQDQELAMGREGHRVGII